MVIRCEDQDAGTVQQLAGTCARGTSPYLSGIILSRVVNLNVDTLTKVCQAKPSESCGGMRLHCCDADYR